MGAGNQEEPSRVPLLPRPGNLVNLVGGQDRDAGDQRQNVAAIANRRSRSWRRISEAPGPPPERSNISSQPPDYELPGSTYLRPAWRRCPRTGPQCRRGSWSAANACPRSDADWRQPADVLPASRRATACWRLFTPALPASLSRNPTPSGRTVSLRPRNGAGHSPAGSADHPPNHPGHLTSGHQVSHEGWH